MPMWWIVVGPELVLVRAVVVDVVEIGVAVVDEAREGKEEEEEACLLLGLLVLLLLA